MSVATVAGLLLVAVPLAFNAAFALLAARFDYPDVLRRPTSEVLAKFRAGGTALVLTWWAFALTAVLMVPLVILLGRAIDDADPTLLAVATATGVLAALVQVLGLIRWPFLVPYLARADADPAASPAPGGAPPPPRGRRRRLPGLQPLPRRRGRRAPRLSPHRRLDHARWDRAHPDGRGPRRARRPRRRHRPGPRALRAGVRRRARGAGVEGRRKAHARHL